VDIARTCALLSVLLYWGAVYYQMVARHDFDPVKVGSGFVLVAGAVAAWIHLRQKHEDVPAADAKEEA
jgi:hypothetical protein